jgi:GNAT superfamily N-acetyltransferase
MAAIGRATTPSEFGEAAALLHDHVELISCRTGFDPLVVQPELIGELDDLAQRHGADGAAMFLARWRSLAVGTIAVRRCDDGSAELKRMYVRPVARGRGIAHRLVEAALATAAAWGCCHVWLETVRGAMDPAIALYRRHGFSETTKRSPTLLVDDIVVMERALSTAGRRCA